MLSRVLKTHIESLPADKFKQTWDCIEALDAAITAGGDTSIIALEYTRLKHMDMIAGVLSGQSATIKVLQSQLNRTALDLTSITAAAHGLGAENDALTKKVARLKKKSKK